VRKGTDGKKNERKWRKMKSEKKKKKKKEIGTNERKKEKLALNHKQPKTKKKERVNGQKQKIQILHNSNPGRSRHCKLGSQKNGKKGQRYRHDERNKADPAAHLKTGGSPQVQKQKNRKGTTERGQRRNAPEGVPRVHCLVRRVPKDRWAVLNQKKVLSGGAELRPTRFGKKKKSSKNCT